MKCNRWLVVLIVLPVAVLLLPQPLARGQGDWPCDERVVDQAGILGSGLGEIERTIDELLELGAEVRVFAMPTTGQNDLDLFVDALQDGCTSWRSDGGVMRSNLIVLGLSLEERLTGLYYGDRWSAILDNEQRRIQADLMNPRFQDGDFAGGILAGLEEIAFLIEQRLRPTGAPTATGTATGTPTIGIVLGGAAGLAALGGGLYAGSRLVRRRLTRRQAQQSARETKMKVASRLLELQERATFLNVDIENLAQEVSTPEVQELHNQLAEVRRQVARTSSDYESVQLAGNDPDREGLSAEEYRGYEASFRELLETLDQVDETASAIQQHIHTLQQLVAQVPETLAQTQAAIEQARQHVEERTRESVNRRADWSLQAAQARLDEARAAGEDKRPREALDLAEKANTLIDEALSTVDLLPALRARIEEVDQRIDVGADTFEQLAQHYAESSWEAIRGNGTEAENRVNWAWNALQLAQEELASPDEDTWQEALQRIEEANGWLDEAASLIGSIESLRQNLEKARREAPREVQSAQVDIDKAAAYIGEHDPDIREQLESDLESAREDLHQADAELALAIPDYLRVVALAQRANAAADRILEQARSEHEAIERLRRKYHTLSRGAEEAASRAEDYVRNHASDVREESKHTLDEARAKLLSAGERRGVADDREDTARREALEQAVSLAQEAETLASKAYEQARQDFQRAESHRRPAVLPIPVPGPAHRPSPSGDWGLPKASPRTGPRRSGGSSDWSRPSSPRRSGSSSSWSRGSTSSRRSGSSSSWGGSSSRRRGGSSTGW